jgi:hypothetical protein
MLPRIQMSSARTKCENMHKMLKREFKTFTPVNKQGTEHAKIYCRMYLEDAAPHVRIPFRIHRSIRSHGENISRLVREES